MKKLKQAVREARRLVHDYWSVLKKESSQRPSAVIPTLFNVLFARSRFGVGPLYYSLYQFSRVPRSEWGNYLTDDPDFKQQLLAMSPPSMHRMAQNKALLYQHCVQHGLSTIPILCVVGKSSDPLPSLRFANGLSDWLEVLKVSPSDLFVKSIDGTYGEGSFAVKRVADDTYAYEGKSGSLADLHGHIVAKLEHEAGWIVQPRLRTHPELSAIASSNGLATVRVVTTIRGGVARLLIAGFKLTVGDNITDNFSKGKSGNLLAAVDIPTGTLSTAWGSRSSDWPEMEAFPSHPETGHRIEGFCLPLWDELVEVALRAQRSLPELASAGWDIAITEHGVMLVEANLTYDLSILQIAHQAGLKKEISSALGINTSGIERVS